VGDRRIEEEMTVESKEKMKELRTLREKPQNKLRFIALVGLISDETGVQKQDVESVLRSMMHQIRIHLRKGIAVSFPSFGKFRVAKRKDRRRVGFVPYRRNPRAQIKMEGQ
jgi:nucleoid DNA-binding protein